MKLDSLAMLSASPGTIDGPAQGSQHWGFHNDNDY